MLKVNNKNTRTTSLTSFCCFYSYLWTYFTPFSSVSIVNFEQVNVSWASFERFGFFQVKMLNKVCLFEALFNLCLHQLQSVFINRVQYILGLACPIDFNYHQIHTHLTSIYYSTRTFFVIYLKMFLEKILRAILFGH